MNVKEIIEKYLKENEYDGLVQEDCECACEISDLFPCGCEYQTCRAGYRENVKNEETGFDFMIIEGKREVKNDKTN
jgi:hypothetical protein